MLSYISSICIYIFFCFSLPFYFFCWAVCWISFLKVNILTTKPTVGLWSCFKKYRCIQGLDFHSDFYSQNFNESWPDSACLFFVFHFFWQVSSFTSLWLKRHKVMENSLQVTCICTLGVLFFSFVVYYKVHCSQVKWFKWRCSSTCLSSEPTKGLWVGCTVWNACFNFMRI